MSDMLSYWVDRHNIIQKVSSGWDTQMNQETWSDRAASQTIIGHSLFDFICDDVTRMYVGSLLDAARLLPASLFRPYRCDAPDTKRFMQMVVSPEDMGLVRVSHKLLRTEPMELPVVAEALLNKAKPFPSNAEKLDKNLLKTDYQIRCSICNHYRLRGRSDWLDAEQLPQAVSTGSVLKVLYGVCPKCIDTLQLPVLPRPSASG